MHAEDGKVGQQGGGGVGGGGGGGACVSILMVSLCMGR